MNIKNSQSVGQVKHQ